MSSWHRGARQPVASLSRYRRHAPGTVDLKRELKELYAPKAGAVADVVVPKMTFLTVDGSGDPNVSESYRHAVESLFTASYAAKFRSNAS